MAARSPTAARRTSGATRPSSTPISAWRTEEGRGFMQFFIEVLTGGLLAGVMYSLVAIGFVLIYKASGVFNFAQGAMVLLAALTFVSLVERGLPFVAALAASLAVMVLLRVAVERAV